jgi:thiosulfate dehydrogenase
MARTRSLLGQLLVLGACLIGCSPVEAVDRGRDLYGDPRLSISPSNVFACATCHDNMPRAATNASATRRYAGYTLYGAAQRPNFWGGGLVLFLDAVNFCYTEFMVGAKLTADDEKGRALLAYLQSIAPMPDTAAPLTLVQNIDAPYLASLPAGDAMRGAALWASTCAPCHGDIHTGNGRLGPQISLVPDATISGFGAMARAVIAEKMRHGKFFGIGGSMPLYSVEALANQEVSDILAYLLP